MRLFLKILIILMPLKGIRKYLKSKIKKKCKKNVNISGNNNLIPEMDYLDNVSLTINGDNNKVYIKSKDFKGNINIYGDNNIIEIEEGISVISGVNIIAGFNHYNFGKIKNSLVRIGKNTNFVSTNITLYEENSSVIIGEDCMFSSNIELMNTDAHPIFSKDSSKLINRAKKMEIQSNCWVGFNVTILKNSLVSKGSIVGTGSVVSKKFKEEDVAIAGNPARVVKEGIYWKQSSNKFINNEE